MLRPGREFPQFRPVGMTPVAPPPMNAPLNAPLNVPMNIPMNVAPHFIPGGGNGYVMPHASGGHFAYPPPPPTPVPPPHLPPFLPPLPAPSFVPPLPPSPPVEAPPPPPPVSSPTTSPSHPLSPKEKIAIAKPAPLQHPVQPPKPVDTEILKNIEGMAEFVVRNGPRYESMARAKHAGDPKFTFLFENDSGPEAIINREFYKWKKEVLQLQAETIPESKSQRHSDLQSDATRSQMATQAVGNREEIPPSPAMSDMDMEDDLVAPSPKRESPGVVFKPGSSGGVSHFNRVDKSSEQNQVHKLAACQSLLMSGSRPEDVAQPGGKTESPMKGKRAHCRLTGDYTGSLIGNYSSDASEDSENSEHSASLGMTGSGSSDHRKEGKMSDQSAKADHVNLSAENAAASKHSEAIFSKEVQCAEVLQLTDDRPLDTANGCEKEDIDDLKASEPQERIAEIRSEIGLPVPDELHQKETLEKKTSPSTLDDIRRQSSSRKSRSHSRSRSRSRSRSLSQSCSRSRSRSRSTSQSLEDGSKSPSPTRSGLPKKSRRGKTSPKDLPNGVQRVESKLQAREKRGAQGVGSNICLNFARGRCFHGNACRFQHQGSDKGLDEVDKVKEFEEHGALKNTASPQNLEGRRSEVVVNNAEPSVEVAVSKKAKRKAGAEKNEASSEKEEAAKRSKLIVETTVMPPQKGISLCSAASDLSVRASGGGLLLAQQDEAASLSAPVVDLLVSEASHLSEARYPSPFSPSNSSRQFIGNLSQVPQPCESLDQGYAAKSEGFGLHQHNPVQYSGPSGFSSSNPYANTINDRDRAFGMTFPGGNHAQVHQPSSGIGENSQFQLHSHGSSMSGGPTGSTLHEYSDLTRSYASSHASEYGLPFQAQSGASQNPMGPSSTFPPSLTSLASSTAVRQQHEHKGFTSFQHGFSSPFSLSAQQHQSLYPPLFPSDALHQSRFSDVANHALSGVYPQSSFSSQSQNASLWSMPGSLGNLSSKGLEMPSITGNSSSYSYALTTIPPLPSIIELPGTTKVSTSSDQYDPLSDSFEPSLSGGPKSTSFSFLKTVEEGKSFGGFSNTLASRLENVSPGLDLGKGDLANTNEAAGDPVVGIVENVSPPEDNRDWSPGQPAEAVEGKQGQSSSKNKKNNFRGLKLLRSAVADHVKEVLKPTWKEGHMSKDAFKNIVKKAVDKVTAALPTHHIPKSQEKVDQFMSSSRMKIAKLVQGYIDKYQKT